MYITAFILFVVIMMITWYELRKDYRAFIRMYKVKTPVLTWVVLTKENDKMLQGQRRYRFVRKDGRRDKRRVWNFKVTYPTIIVINHYKVRMWNLTEATRVFMEIEQYMRLPLEQIPFRGKIEGNPLRFFRDSPILFQRWCGKFLSFYGYRCVLSYGKQCDLIAYYKNDGYLVKSILSREPVTLNDITRLSRQNTGLGLIIITTSKFTDSAINRAFSKGIRIMDLKAINRSFSHEEILFM